MPYSPDRKKLVGDATKSLNLEVTACQDNITDQLGAITIINGKEYPTRDLNEIFLQLIDNDVVLNKITAKLAANNTFTGSNNFTQDILLANNKKLLGRSSGGGSYQPLIGFGSDDIAYIGDSASPTKILGSTNPIARINSTDYTIFHKGYMGVSAGLDAGTLATKTLAQVKYDTQKQVISSTELHNLLTESFEISTSSGNVVIYAKNKILSRKAKVPFTISAGSDMVGAPTGWSHGEVLILPHAVDGLYFQLIAKGGSPNKVWLGSYINGVFGGWVQLLDNNDLSTINTNISKKANIGISYTKQEVDNKLNKKVNISDCPYGAGDILQTTDTANPATRWLGTTWQKIEGRMIVGTGSGFSLGSTGGHSTITLSVAQLPKHRFKVDNHIHTQPSHTHTLNRPRYSGDDGGLSNYGWGADGQRGAYVAPSTSAAGGENTGGSSPYTNYQGSGSAINIMNPYYVANIWRRIS